MYSNYFAFGTNNGIEMTVSQHGAMRYVAAKQPNQMDLT